MSRFLPVAVIAVTLALICPDVQAQSFDWSKVSPAEKLMARRAARLDALRELSELVKGLPIGNGRTLGDLGPDASLFLTGAAEVGPPKYLPTGFCKLRMQLPGQSTLANALALGRHRGVQIDMDALRRALGASLEATGLGKARSSRAPMPNRAKRQGQLVKPQKRFAQRGDEGAQQPRQSERRVRRLLEEADKRTERWRREWKQQADDWEKNWRRDAERWRSKQNGWERDRSRWAQKMRFSTMSIEKQYEMGKPIGGGWRLLPDGSMIRLLSERTVRQPLKRTGTLKTPRWGEEVIEESVTEEILEERVIIK